MEKWKEIEGFEAYEVSDLGRVRRRLPGRPGAGTSVGRVLKPHLSNGYPRTALYDGQKIHNFFVHILVAKAFVPNTDPTKLTQVNHMDGVKTNAKASNLEWRSRRGDRIHAMQMGLQGAGVHRSVTPGKWRAQYKPTKEGKDIYLGTFATKEQAQAAYKKAVNSIPYEP